VQRLENGANLRQVQQELGHASIRTTERYQRCLAPRLENHPFTKVRALMAAHSLSTRRHRGHPGGAKIPVVATAACTPTPSTPAPRETGGPPLARLLVVDLRGLQLPFVAGGEPLSPAQRFAAFLKNRLLRGILHRPS